MQALGGTGGLKVGADFLKRLHPGANVLISDPSWENHRALFTNAGFEVGTYPYYDAATRGIRFDAMLAALQAAAAGTIVVLHACCHNPTGCDLTARAVGAGRRRLRRRAGWCPSSTWPTRASATASPKTAPRCGCSWPRGLRLLRRRPRSRRASRSTASASGALSVVCGSADEAARVLSQLKIVIRTNYSNPPTFGAQVVATVLTTPGAARDVGGGTRRHARAHPRHAPGARRPGCTRPASRGDLDYITRQKGMFSYSGLGKAQMQRLRSEFGVYGVDSGRICVAAINSRNIDAVVAALARVMRDVTSD